MQSLKHWLRIMETMDGVSLFTWSMSSWLEGIVITFQYVTYYDCQHEETVTGYIKKIFDEGVLIQTKYKNPKELFCFYYNIKGDIKQLTEEEEIIIWKLE